MADRSAIIPSLGGWRTEFWWIQNCFVNMERKKERVRVRAPSKSCFTVVVPGFPWNLYTKLTETRRQIKTTVPRIVPFSTVKQDKTASIESDLYRSCSWTNLRETPHEAGQIQKTLRTKVAVCLIVILLTPPATFVLLTLRDRQDLRRYGQLRFPREI